MGRQWGITAEDLVGLVMDQRRYVADHLWRDMLQRVVLREDYAPDRLVLSPAVAAQLGARGFDGRPTLHEPNPKLVSLLLTDTRQERTRA